MLDYKNYKLLSPVRWISKPQVTIFDETLDEYEVVWTVAGHPRAVFPTTYNEVIRCTGGTPMVIGL